jgi:MFS family permease
MCAAPCLGDRFGYVRISRISAAVFLVSPQLATFTFGLYPFIMLCLVMPVCAFGLSIISIIKCVWEFYPSSRNKITAWLSVAYGLGVFLWSFVFMHMMNPENEEPTVR